MDFGYNYYPGIVGSYVIYAVDSISYNDAFQRLPDTTSYLLKETIASEFSDNSGRPTLRLERCVKKFNKNLPYDSIPWSPPRVWTANRTTTALEKKEENTIFVRLAFPVREGKEWNGNAYNTFDQRTYEFVTADKKETVNNLTFDSVATVKQFEQVDFIQNRYEAEKYARNVGLVYKERDSIYTGGTGQKNGFTYTQKIISYGK